MNLLEQKRNRRHLSEKKIITRFRMEDSSVGEIQVRKFTDWVRPVESRMSFAEMPCWFNRCKQPANGHGDS